MRKTGNLNLYKQARSAMLLRGLTVKDVAEELNMHRNTLRLALRTDECPKARAKVMRFLKLAA